MSRIGNVAIAVPSGVDVTLVGDESVKVKGPKGTLSIPTHGHVKLTKDGSGVHVARHSDANQDRAFHGLYHRLIKGMIEGVTKGFTKELELVGVGYRAALEGKTLVLNLGFSHDLRIAPPEGISFVTPKPTTIIVSGADKQQVGQIAAIIREQRPPEPYKGKGVRYTGEHVRRKVGKAAGK